MAINTTLRQEIENLFSENTIFTENKARFQYLFESYMGGEVYRQGNYLTRYQLETDGEYMARLKATPLENHCQSIVQTYNSFMFREPPERKLGSIENLPEVEDFFLDADLDGRSLNAFMKEVATWSSVFGNVWILVAKPNVQAQNRSDELVQGVRPYVSLITPLVMLDWSYTRTLSGKYSLDYIKYVEDINASIHTVKEWRQDSIKTTVVDIDENLIHEEMVDTNQLGMIPAICVYNKKSTLRGLGISDLADISDVQRAIYNLNSELDQGIRLDAHPSLVKTPNTSAGAGAGAIIHMPEDLDPALKPYILQNSGGNIDAILKTKQSLLESIDKMANTGAIRETESRVMSGVSRETEFALLNARLSEKADNLELAEEQLWTIFAEYQGYTWDGEVDYPDSFGIKDLANDVKLLIESRKAVTDPKIIAMLEHEIAEQHFSEEEMEEYQLELVLQQPYPEHEMIDPQTQTRVTVTSEQQHQDLTLKGWVENN